METHTKAVIVTSSVKEKELAKQYLHTTFKKFITAIKANSATRINSSSLAKRVESTFIIYTSFQTHILLSNSFISTTAAFQHPVYIAYNRYNFVIIIAVIFEKQAENLPPPPACYSIILQPLYKFFIFCNFLSFAIIQMYSRMPQIHHHQSAFCMHHR